MRSHLECGYCVSRGSWFELARRVGWNVTATRSMSPVCGDKPLSQVARLVARCGGSLWRVLSAQDIDGSGNHQPDRDECDERLD